MPTYITLLKYTQQGIGTIKQSPGRLDTAKKAFKQTGAEIRQFYLVLGRYDAVVISEAPDDETAARLSLATASQGNVSTETLRAFTEEEFRRIVGALS
jgi:uncharacterized protein with GYD domain